MAAKSVQESKVVNSKLCQKIQAASKEYHEQARLLNDKEFLRSNCRVQLGAEQGNQAPAGRGLAPGKNHNAKDDAVDVNAADERREMKEAAQAKAADGARKRELNKRKQRIG